jgi:hypothetical protein
MSLAAVALLCLLAPTLSACAGKSGKGSSPTAQKLQREDLVAIARALHSAQAPVAREVAATKAAWPAIASGLPADAGGLSGDARVRAASESSTALALPKLFGEAQARTLTGPAAQLAGLFRSYALLSARGWNLLEAGLVQIASGTPASAHFARENAALYIESIYDGHFTLAQIGKKLSAAYDTLGGARAFGAALGQADVDALARTYSEASDRLHPHVARRIGS